MPVPSCRLAALLAIAILASAAPLCASEVTGLFYYPDSKRILSAHMDGTLRLIDSASGKELNRVDAHRGGTYSLTATPDGKLLATGGVDRVARLWQAEGLKLLHSFAPHGQPVASVAISPDGAVVAAGSYDGVIRLYDAATGKVKNELNAEFRVTGLAYSPDGKELAVTGSRVSRIVNFPVVDSQEAHVFDATTLKLKRVMAAKGTAVAWSPAGNATAVAGYGTYVGDPDGRGGVRINNVTLRAVHRISLRTSPGDLALLDLEREGAAAVFSSDGRYLATGPGSDHHINGQTGGSRFGVVASTPVVRVYEAVTGKMLLEFRPAAGSGVVLAFSPDRRTLAAGRRDGKIDYFELTPPAVKAAGEPDTKALAELFDRLAQDDVRSAYEAVWLLAAAGDVALPILKGVLKPARIDRQRIEQLIGDLHDSRFKVRNAAMKELSAMGLDAEAALRRLGEQELELHVRRLVTELLQKIDGRSLPPGQLQSLRAVEVLERLASPAARDLLAGLAAGDPDAALTREAKSALVRLGARGQ